MSTQQRGQTDTLLSGRRLVLVRTVWITLVVFMLGYFVASLPAVVATLQQPCVGAWCTNSTGRLTADQIQSLSQAGIPLDAYAWSWLAFACFTALVQFVIAGILFWRKSDDWMALLVAFTLISSGVDGVTGVLLYSSSPLGSVENVVFLIADEAALFTVALFPNGRFVPRWSRWVPLVYLVYVASYLLFLGPLHVPNWAMYNSPLNVLAWFGSFAVLTLTQLYRYFRVSNVVERQQTKWVAFGFLVVLVGSLVGARLGFTLSSLHNGTLYALGNFFSSSIIGLPLPLTLGVAMFRYRLWDIDVIINRTLVYGALTALLVGIYLSSVVLLDALLQPFIGQGNDLAVVASTLLIAALFMPLRRRIQAVIDRRFYRRKYDAARTLEAFSRTARDEVDLDSLTGRLVEVVDETMQPAHVGLWLRQPARKA